MFDRITIIGVGLIGGSLARAIRNKKLCRTIVGYFRSKDKLKKALRNKIVDEGYLDFNKSIEKCDLIVFSLPINQIINFMSKIKNPKNCHFIAIDVGSSKYQVTKAADKLKLNFVGTHPLAGSEKKGADFSSATLFKNSNVIITPTKKTTQLALKKIKKFWRKLDTKVTILSPTQHDKILSYTSHLPHMVSFCLISAIPNNYMKFGASGLKDTTRIALSDPQIWSDIILSNKKETIVALKTFERNIANLKNIIINNKRRKLISFINSSSTKRNSLR
jgi:prephenate dehydrogenase